MLNPKYAYMSAYLKGEEPRVITLSHIDKMARASNIQDALAAIRETDIGGYLEETPVKDFNDLDKALWGYFAHRISYVESFKSYPRDMMKVSRAYVEKYDVSNVKAAAQSISTGEATPLIPVGILHNNNLLSDLSQVEKIEDIAEMLTKSQLGNYVPVLQGYDASGGPKAKLQFESRLDAEYYKGLLKMARDIREGSVLSKAYGLIIDLTNLQIACRAVIEGIGTEAGDCIISGGYIIAEKAVRELLPFKLADIPRRLEYAQYRDVANEILTNYDKTKSITSVEETIDKYKFSLLKDYLSPRVLSPLVMAWYLILKEVEIRNLRLVIKAITDGVSVEEVKRYLVA